MCERKSWCEDDQSMRDKKARVLGGKRRLKCEGVGRLRYEMRAGV